MTSSTTLVSVRALKRARQAMRCLPFRRAFYEELEKEARSSTQLSSQQNWMAISRKPLHQSSTEDDLIWLIQLGVLRREVDGQGLTERVRLRHAVDAELLHPLRAAQRMIQSGMKHMHLLRQ